MINCNVLKLINISKIFIVFPKIFHDILNYIGVYSIISAWQTYNALFAVRCILKYLIETVGEEEMLKHIEAPQSNAENETMSSYRLEEFFEALIALMVDVPLW